MKKLIVATLFLSSLAFAGETVIADETFKTTFSDYGHLNDLISCRPGYKGFYPTPDVISIKGGVELGFSMDQRNFTAYHMGMSSLKAGEKRPYAEGCGPAMEQLKKQIESQETVEITVHRRVVSYPSVDSRVYRNRKGDVQHVKYVESELHYESYRFELAGFKFQLGRSLSGKSRDL